MNMEKDYAGGAMNHDIQERENLSKDGIKFLNSLSKKEIEILKKSIEFQTTIMTAARILKWCFVFATGSLIAFWQIIDHLDKIRKFFMGKM